jgi:hypothetical protein
MLVWVRTKEREKLSPDHAELKLQLVQRNDVQFDHFSNMSCRRCSLAALSPWLKKLLKEMPV